MALPMPGTRDGTRGRSEGRARTHGRGARPIGLHPEPGGPSGLPESAAGNLRAARRSRRRIPGHPLADWTRTDDLRPVHDRDHAGGGRARSGRALAERARGALSAIGFGEVTVVVGDGSLGFPGRAPYDCILATAGAPRIPGSWPPQLARRGRIVAPVGASPHSQVLVIATRREDGSLETRESTSCAFVPLVGKQAWPA